MVNVKGRPVERSFTPAVYVEEELSQLGEEFKVISEEITWTWDMVGTALEYQWMYKTVLLGGAAAAQRLVALCAKKMI